jgi:NAD(P)-dependent dehydrogenase (short-subunit alcohol dehydrogenase family)
MNKIAIITGASSGIGLELTKKLFKLDWTIILACRNKEKTIKIINEIELNSHKLLFYPLDLSNQESINNFCEDINIDFDHIDLLVNNAGIPATKRLVDIKNKEGRTITLNQCFMTNFFGHYIIVTKLLGVLKNSDKPRVVNISSVYSNFSNGNPDIIFQRKNNYALSKLAMVYLTKKIRDDTNISSIAVNPGYVDTSIWEYGRDKLKGITYIFNIIESYIRYFCSLSAEESAKTILQACLLDNAEIKEKGIYMTPYKKIFVLTLLLNEVLGRFHTGIGKTIFIDPPKKLMDNNVINNFFDFVNLLL